MDSMWLNVGKQRLVFTLVLFASVLMFGGAITTCGGGGGSDAEVVVDTTVFGRVLSAVDESPMQGVRITVQDVAGVVTTDELGRFMVPLPAAGTYAVTASLEGYTYAQRRAEAADKELVSVADMFLTPLDPKEIVIGPEGGRDTNSDGRIELEVPPGALDETVSMRATWFERGKYLPNFLPEASHFTYAAELTPDGQEFAAPAVVRMRNEREFAPGTPIPVGVYSPETLEWTHESMGVVSSDGQWVEFEVGHFSPRDCNLGAQDPAGSGEPGDADDQTDASRRNDQACGSVAAGSSIDVLDAHLSVDHVLPAYLTLSQTWSVGLQYNSNLHNGLPTLGLTYDISQTSTVVPERTRFLVEVAGQRVERYFQPVEGPADFVYRWDGRDGIGRQLPDGVYTYRLTLANEYEVEFTTVERFGGAPTGMTGVFADELRGLEATFEGTVALRRDDPARTTLGAGWGIIGLYALYIEGDRLFISGGDGNLFVFTRVSETQLDPTPGNFTSLIRQGTGYLWTLQDRTRITFDADGRMTTSADLNDNTTTYGYDGLGRLSTRVDPVGGTTTLAYDAAGRLSSITDPHDRATLFQVDDAGDLVRITNPDGSLRSFNYDDAHRMVSQTDAGRHTTTYHYDQAGSVTQVDHPDGNSSAFSTIGAAGSAHLRPGDVGTESNPSPLETSFYTDPEEHTYAFTVNTFGTRTSITDPLGRTTLMHRDRNDLLSLQQAPGSDAVTYAYDASGNPIRMSGPASFGGGSDQYEFGWDTELNVLLSVTDEAVGMARSTYTDRGNLETAITMDGRSYRFVHDDRGLRESMTIGGRTTRFFYDDRGNLSRVVDPTGQPWVFGRDAYGNVNRLVDPDGRSRTAVYNEMNLPVLFTNGAGAEVELSYEPATGNLSPNAMEPFAVVSSIEDGRGHATHFGYDEMYRLRSMTDALERSHTYTYDRVGRLRRHTRPTTDWVEYIYDDAGRVTQKNLSTGEANEYAYDDTSGRLSSASNGTSRLTFTYDSDGFVESIGTTFAPEGRERTLSYQYRVSGSSDFVRWLEHRPDEFTQFVMAYSETSGWLPTSISGGDGSGIDLTMNYDDGGRLHDWRQVGGSSSAVFEYDDADRLQVASYYDGDDPAADPLLARLSWGYTLGGLRDRHSNGVPGDTFDDTFGYDVAGRLISATHEHSSNDDEAYSYDEAGNRYIDGSESQYQYDDANQLREDPSYTYTYDANGSRQSRTARVGGARTEYHYDSENRLIRVTLPSSDNVHFAYDPLGRLVEKVDESTGESRRYLYDGDEVLAEFDGTGNMVRRYVSRDGIDMLLGVISGADHYIAGTDPLGTVIGFIHAGGGAAGSYQYQAFGAIANEDGGIENERTFAGRDYERTTDLYHFRARFYDPNTGQFLQRDPLVYKAASKPYAYAGNNPTNYRDPYGLNEGEFAAFAGLFNKRVVEPLVQRGVGDAFAQIPNIPHHINSSIVPLPSVGNWFRAGVGQYYQWKDVIEVFGAENPYEAGINWYDSQPWNPVRGAMLESFLTMGGTMPRHESRVGPACVSSGDRGRLIQPNLHSSKEARRRHDQYVQQYGTRPLRR